MVRLLHHRLCLFTAAVVAAGTLVALGGCASGGKPISAAEASSPAGPAAGGRALAVESTEPIEAEAVTLAVKGLSCPQCATNIDRTLGRIEGVRFLAVDLAAGKVDMTLGGKSRPSPARLAKAVSEAGFSIDAITVR